MSRMDDFEKELEHLLNRYSLENDSDTPDFVLARYLKGCLMTWNEAVVDRETWYGRALLTPASTSENPSKV